MKSGNFVFVGMISVLIIISGCSQETSDTTGKESVIPSAKPGKQIIPEACCSTDSDRKNGNETFDKPENLDPEKRYDTKTTPKVSKPDKWAFLAENVADVNGVKISKEDLLSYIQIVSDPREIYTLSGKKLKLYSREMLERVINQLLISQIASGEGFVPGYKLIKSETDEMVRKMPENEKREFTNYLNSQKMSVDEFCKKIAENQFKSRQFAIEVWRNQKIKADITLTLEEIEDFYNKSGDVVSVSQILIQYNGNSAEAKAEAEKEAEKIRAAIKNEADFRAFALAESHCQTNFQGMPGALKPFGRGAMVQEFEDVAFSLPEGNISDVIETQYGFHIIRIDKKSKKTVLPFEKVKIRIEDQLMEIKAMDLVSAKLKEAKKQCIINVTAFN